MRLENGVVIVTGGSSGLGAATAAAVKEAGGVPHVLDIADPPYGVDGERVDLADSAAAAAAVDRAAERHGRLDAVVTAAGTDSCGKLIDVDPRAWERVIMVNLVGTAAVVRAALPHLERTNGRVVTIGSTLGHTALSDATAYCASKFGVVGFTRALSAELAGKVGVTMVVPGGMQTAFFDGREEQYKPPSDAKLNDPANVARTVLFALGQPPGCEVRELVVTPATESSWPP
jgi:NAD(P)-dependent dehydrogenase (short-subunit alcohol dehydrogenase family)